MFPKKGASRLAAILLLYSVTLGVVLYIATSVRDYGISQLSASYSSNSATISVDKMTTAEIAEIVEIALKDSQVKKKMNSAPEGSYFLNYVLPVEWYFSDLPIEVVSAEREGHHQPKEYDRTRVKILFTQSKLADSAITNPVQIIKKTVARIPVVVAKVDLQSKKVFEVTSPPTSVRWGNISTPLF
jgi:hypothetical protein